MALPQIKEVYNDRQIEIASRWFLSRMPEVVLLLETGMRRGELVGLHPEDIDRRRRLYRVPVSYTHLDVYKRQTVYCNGSQNLKNLSGGVGELRIDNLGADKADWGWLFFDKSPVPSGEVLDSASVLAVYCHAPYPLSLILGQIAGPSWNGPEWKITSGGVRGAGNLSCQIGITTENQTGAAQFWVCLLYTSRCV